MDDTHPKISVVLPFYNAPFLKEAIDSILNQSYQDFELILIDNGSTDSSKEVAKSYESHEKVRLLHENKRGVAYAANRGIVAAKGQFIARMDADDISLPDRLEVQRAKLISDDDLMVVSGLIEYFGPPENEGFIHYVNWLNSVKSPEEIALNQFVEFPIANPSTMIRKEVFDKYGLFQEEQFPEDYDFFLRLQSQKLKMEKVNQPVIKWRDSESRLTRTDEKYSQDSFFKLKAKYLSEWLATNNPFHPSVYVWGAGRLSRKRANYLLDYGAKIQGFIDVKEGKDTIHYSQVPSCDNAFIVSYVSNRGAREEIKSFLIGRGFEEGVHFILAA